MSYQSVVNTIRSAANLVNPAGSFVHGRKVDGSRESIGGEFPLIILYPFTTTRNEFSDTSSLIVGFFVQDSATSSPEDREAMIAQMDVLSNAFEFQLTENKLIRVTSLIKEPQYQFYGGTVSGYAIRFNLESLQEC